MPDGLDGEPQARAALRSCETPAVQLPAERRQPVARLNICCYRPDFTAGRRDTERHGHSLSLQVL
jgi:hypothetical protein